MRLILYYLVIFCRIYYTRGIYYSWNERNRNQPSWNALADHCTSNCSPQNEHCCTGSATNDATSFVMGRFRVRLNARNSSMTTSVVCGLGRIRMMRHLSLRSSALLMRGETRWCVSLFDNASFDAPIFRIWVWAFCGHATCAKKRHFSRFTLASSSHEADAPCFKCWAHHCR